MSYWLSSNDIFLLYYLPSRVFRLMVFILCDLFKQHQDVFTYRTSVKCHKCKWKILFLHVAELVYSSSFLACVRLICQIGDEWIQILQMILYILMLRESASVSFPRSASFNYRKQRHINRIKCLVHSCLPVLWLKILHTVQSHFDCGHQDYWGSA